MEKARVAETLRIWWQAQKARANYGEFEQAVLRVGIGFILVSAYYAWVDWSTQIWGLYLCWGFVAYTLIVFAWGYRAREGSVLFGFSRLLVTWALARFCSASPEQRAVLYCSSTPESLYGTGLDTGSGIWISRC